MSSRAARFEVTVDFLLQQVTYLTDRHASQVRAQMRKVQAAARNSATPSPAPGAESSTTMAKTSSAQGVTSHTRAPSSLSIRKESVMNRNDGSTPGTPKVATASLHGASRPQSSRDASSSTAAQTGASGNTAGSLRLKTGTKPPSPKQPGRHRLASIPITSPSTPLAEAAPIIAATETASPSPEDSSSERESDESSSPAQSRIIRRPPRFQQQQHHQDGPRTSFLDEMDEDEAEPAFLPFRGKTSTEVSGGRHGGSAQYTDPSATLRGDPRDFAANAERRLQNVTGAEPASSRAKGKGKERILQQSQTSDSSTSSAALPSKRSGHLRQPSNPLSPRRTAELKARAYSREGSDGAPSMGSSFSDLDGKIVIRAIFF